MARPDLPKEYIYDLCSAMYECFDDLPFVDLNDFMETILKGSFDPINNRAMHYEIKDLMTRFYLGFLNTNFGESYEDQESALIEFVDILFEDEKILQFLDQQGIRSIYHFTRSENLESILHYGFVPVDMFDEFCINPKRNDSIRLDRMTHCTSFSISFPNYKLFYSLRNEHKGKSWVVIEIDPRMLVSACNNCHFFADNAAAIGQREKEHSGVEALRAMFCDSFTKKSGYVINRAGLKGISKNFTTNPQAEVLVDGIVESQYIRKLHFRELTEELEYLIDSFRNSRRIVDSEITPDLFDKRADWQSWSQ